MTKEIIIILLLVALIYYYRQSRKPLTSTETNEKLAEDIEKKLETIRSFLKEQLNSDDVKEVKEKLGEKTLVEILEENQDWETEVDTLTRTKNSLEQDLTAQANAFQARLREKDREIKKFKEDLKALENVRGQLTSEKQQHKGSLERIKLLTEQITKLEQQVKKMPGEFPKTDKEVELVKEHQEQLRQINLLFDEKAKDYAEIDFNGLYEALKTKIN